MVWCWGGCDRGLVLNPFADAAPEADLVDSKKCQDVDIVKTVTHESEAGDWTVVVPHQVELTGIKILKPGSREAALALEWVSGAGDVSGFVLSQKATRGDARSQALEIVNRVLEAAGPKKVFAGASLRHLGTLGKTHDGYPVISGTVVDLSKASEERLHGIRNSVFPLILGGDLSRYEGLPRASKASGRDFVLVLSTILRLQEGRVVVTGGVVTLNDHESSLSQAATRAADMADSTMVARRGDKTSLSCETTALATPRAVDVIWVIDGSASMADVRTTRLHKGVVAMWAEAQALGLDFRMAVLSMGRVKDGAKTLGMGLCNPEPYDTKPGRFWSPPDELELFKKCVLKPAGNVSKDRVTGSFGLLNLREAMLTLLPRATKDPRRLRTGAQVVVVFASDVEAGSVSDLFSAGVPPYPFTSGVAAMVDDLLRPHVHLLLGKDNPANKPYLPAKAQAADLAGSLAYALITDPQRGCSQRSRGTGYIEVAGALGGWTDHICHPPKGTEHLLVSLVHDLARRVRPFSLGQSPISSTVTVKTLLRARLDGFDVHHASNSLLFYEKSGSAGVLKGNLRVGYLSWD